MKTIFVHLNYVSKKNPHYVFDNFWGQNGSFNMQQTVPFPVINPLVWFV